MSCTTYAPSAVALKVGVAEVALARVALVGGTAPLGPETIVQAYVVAKRVLDADSVVAPCRTTRSSKDVIGRPGTSTAPPVSRDVCPCAVRKSATRLGPVEAQKLLKIILAKGMLPKSST